MTSVLLTPAFLMPNLDLSWTFSIHIPNHLLHITPRTVAVQTQLVHTCTFPVFLPPSSQLSRLEISALPSPSPPESKIFHLRKIPTIQPSLSLHFSCHCLVLFHTSHLGYEGSLNHFWGISELSSKKSRFRYVVGRGEKMRRKTRMGSSHMATGQVSWDHEVWRPSW